MGTVHATVARQLLTQKANTMFGVMGDANMQYIADYIHSGGRYLGAVDERGAVLMAVGFGRMTRSVAVATVTHGPGLTNAYTSLVEAARSNTALVVLTGDTPPVRDYVQALNMAEVLAGSGAIYRRVLDPDEVAGDVGRAFALAESACLPVVLDIPHRFLGVESNDTVFRAVTAPVPAAGPNDDALDQAVGIIAAARRPVVLAGRGAALSNGRAQLLELARALGAPVATTLLGREFFAGAEFDLGVVGTIAHDLTVDVVNSSDCVIAFGAGLNQHTTAHGSLLDGRAVVHVDINAASIGKYAQPTASVVGDAATVAHQIKGMLEAADHTAGGFCTAELSAKLRQRDRRADFRDATGGGTVDPRAAMIRLDEVLPTDRVVVTDVGRFVIAPWKYLRVADPLSFTHTAAFGSIGLGLATAIGAAAADPSRPTVVVVGDGGLMMAIGELSTAVRHRLPLIVVVLNDRCYGSEWEQLKRHGEDPKLSLIDWPPLVDVARSMGASGIEISRLTDLEQIPAYISEGHLPLLVDVHTDPALSVGEIR